MKNLKTILIFLVFSNNIIAQESPVSSDVSTAEAMFMYNIARHLEYPINKRSEYFTIGVYGSSGYKQIETYFLNKKVGVRPILVKKISTIEELSECNILFITFSRTKEMKLLEEKIKDWSTLIITEKVGSIDLGSGINFLMIGDKLQYEIKPSNIEKYGIKITTQLRSMAYKNY